MELLLESQDLYGLVQKCYAYDFNLECEALPKENKEMLTIEYVDKLFDVLEYH